MTKETDNAGPLRQPTPSELVSRRQCRPLTRQDGRSDRGCRFKAQARTGLLGAQLLHKDRDSTYGNTTAWRRGGRRGGRVRRGAY